MKIGILLVESLPMPPVKGGAVENLVQLIIDRNEQLKDAEFYVYSKYDAKARQIAKEYDFAHYYYYKPSMIAKILALGLKVIKKVFGKFAIVTPSLYEILAYKKFKSHDIHHIVLENCPSYAIFFNRKNEFDITLHLHNDYLYEKNKENELLLSRIQRVMTVSDFIKRRVLKIAPRNLPVNVCYNGIKTDVFSHVIDSEDLVSIREAFGISKKEKVIIFTGRLVANKGVKELIQAFAKVMTRMDGVRLLIVGGLSFSNNKKNDYVREIENMSASLNGKVTFTGFVDYAEICKILQLADLLVVPSVCYEAFPLSTLEGMASGLPVVVSDAGGMLEQVTEETGIVVKRGKNFVDDLADSILSLLSNPQKMHYMGRQAQMRARDFSDEKMYNRFMELIK